MTSRPSSAPGPSAAASECSCRPAAMFGSGTSSTTRAGPSRRGSPTTTRARRAASRPRVGLTSTGVGAAAHSATASTRPAASASRSSGRRPSSTALVIARQTLSTAASARSWPRQSASAPASERPHGAFLDADRVRHRAHLERVRDDEPVEAELGAEQPASTLALSVAGASSRDGTTMCAVMIAFTSASIAARNGSSAASRSPSARGSSRCESCAVSPWPGKCLAHAATRHRWRPSTNAAHVARDERGIGAERADADHGVVGVRVHVRAGSQVEVDPGPGAEGADRGADLGRDGDVVDDAERQVPRVRAAGRHLQARDVAALLVRGHDHGRVLGAQRRRQLGDLLHALHVPAEQADAAEALGQPPPHPVRRLVARESRARCRPARAALARLGGH